VSVRRFALVFVWLTVWACARGVEGTVRPHASTTATARSWPEADALFTRDPQWLGGDAAVSVPLDGDRILWLFGDSFIARVAGGSRADASFVHNSIGLQHGADPSRARMRFYAGARADTMPASFFADDGASWFWPGDGLYRDHVLTLFLERMRPDAKPGGLGFVAMGWSAVRVRNADAEPSAWVLEPLQTPDTGELGIVGASVLCEGEHVLAYGVREPGDHAVMLLRWPLTAFTRGDLQHPEYFRGGATWDDGPGSVVIAEGATEFSVSSLGRERYVQVQSRGFGAAPIALRFARTPGGPFSATSDVYLPPEAAQRDVLLYAARAHPELEGGSLVITYASNGLDFARVVADRSLYFPRFVRVALH
jgi:hypothetical protein